MVVAQYLFSVLICTKCLVSFSIQTYCKNGAIYLKNVFPRYLWGTPLHWNVLKNHLMRASQPFSHIWVVFPCLVFPFPVFIPILGVLIISSVHWTKATLVMFSIKNISKAWKLAEQKYTKYLFYALCTSRSYSIYHFPCHKGHSWIQLRHFPMGNIGNAATHSCWASYRAEQRWMQDSGHLWPRWLLHFLSSFHSVWSLTFFFLAPTCLQAEGIDFIVLMFLLPHRLRKKKTNSSTVSSHVVVPHLQRAHCKER